MIKRILVISSCLIALICVLVFPAGAADLDYNDFITDVTVDGDYDVVTVSLPIDGALWLLQDLNGNELSRSSKTLTYNFNGDVDYSLWLYPIFPNNILLSNIPDNTLFVLEVDNDLSQAGYWDSGRLSVTGFMNYYGDTSSTVVIPHTVADFMNSVFAFEISKNNMYSRGAFSVRFQPLRFDSGMSSISLKSFTLKMSISSLYRLQQETGKTNEILKEVEKQLADQGQSLDDVLGAQQDTNNKLDGIINDKVDPSLPSDGDIVGDLDDAEGQIRDDAQSGLDQGASVQQSAIQILGQYLSAFACVSWIFDRFSTIPFVSGLLALSFSLGITGAILGIGLSIARTYTGSSRSSRSARSKGG